MHRPLRRLIGAVALVVCLTGCGQVCTGWFSGTFCSNVPPCFPYYC